MKTRRDGGPNEPDFVPLPIVPGAAQPESTWAASPTGSVAGSAFGAVPAGLSEGEEFSNDERYWRENHFDQPFGLSAPYETYASAYRLGGEAFARYGRDGSEFDDVREKLKGEYAEGGPPLTWVQAEPAVRAAWNRARDRGAARSG